jgi:excisionase family DNA binding protein
METLTFDQLYALPTVVDLMTAARALGIGRTKAYRLAHDGQFPVRIIRVGTHYHIPTADLLKILGLTPVPLPRTSPENQNTETPDS